MRSTLHRLAAVPRAPALLAALLLAGSAAAEQLERFGDLEVHYMVFNSTTLEPAIAERYAIVRDERRAVVNVAGRRVAADGSTTAVPLTIEAEVRNLVGQARPLPFREVEEPGAVYYLATVPFTDRETLRFRLRVTDRETGRTHAMRFQKELWAQ
jgi:hypothetical protein